MGSPPTDFTQTWGQAEADLPYLSKKDTLKRYRMRVEGVKSWRENERYEKTWERLRDIYRLRTYESAVEEDRIVVAIAFATINVIEPSISINYPKITVLATQEAEDDQATIAETVINYWWQHYHIQTQLRSAAKDFLIYGHGWLKVGYRYVEVEKPLHPDDHAAMHSDLVDQANQFALDNPHLAGDLPTDHQIAGALPTTETVPLEDRPFVERVSPFDMFVDPEATCLEDARWVVQRIVRPIEEVKADTRYRAGVRRKLEADGSVKWQNEKSRYHIEVETGRITLWEFYDLTRRQMCVFAESGDDFLVDPRPFPYTYGLPFVMVRDYNVPDQFYPIGELEALEPLQNEINETRTAMVRARKESIRKYVYHRNAFDSAGIAALRSDRDNTMVSVDDNTPLEQAVKPLEQNQTNPELYKHSDVILADLDRVSGVSEYQRGELPEIRRTATEASIIQDAANSRAADKLATVEHAVAEVARRLLQLAQLYMTGEQTARKTGTSGESKWFTFSRDDIMGEFDFTVESGSMQPQNETFRRQQALQMTQALAPFMDAGVIAMDKLAEKILRDGFGIKNVTQFINPPPPPDQPPPPHEKLVETIAYKDTPPDIQRQLEKQAGLQPSVLGNMPNPASGPAPTGPTGHGVASQEHQQPEAAPGQHPNGGGALGPGAGP